jgi:predicted TIM-barrel fold metal-dependent hydrolase
VKFVLAHSGLVVCADEAICAGYICENVFLECSWTTLGNARSIVSRLGCGKLIYGSDHIENMAVELAKLNALNLSDDDLELITCKNTENIFGVKCQ